MCQVTFWLNANKGGNPIVYSGPVAISGNVHNGIDCLETDDNAWLVAYSDGNYGGDYLLVEPGTPLSDLNKVSRGNSGGDWKNQIASFIIYQNEPSFWASGIPNTEVNLVGCELLLCSGTNYRADNRLFQGNYAMPDTIDQPWTNPTTNTIYMTVDSLINGPSSWAIIYDQANYQGNNTRIYPGTPMPDLNQQQRGTDGKDWKHQIRSFQQWDHLPSNWNLSFNPTDFNALFANNTPESSNASGPSIGYITQDASYRIYSPAISFPDTTTMSIDIDINHLIDLSIDDDVNLSIVINTDGSLNAITYQWNAGKADQVPPGVIKTVDVTVNLAADLLVFETLGISEEVSTEFIEVFDTCCSVFNKISTLLNKFTDEDGGRFYLIALVCHIANRAYNCVQVAGTEQSVRLRQGGDTPAFDQGLFLQNMKDISGTSGVTAWAQWPGTIGNLNQQSGYTVGSYNYRTWYQETSVMASNLGMLVSCKIDYERTTGDDHIIILTGFSRKPTGSGTEFTYEMVFAQASVQFHGSEDNNVIGAPVQASACGGDMGNAIYNSLSEILSINFGSSGDSTNDGRHTLPDIARRNINAMMGCVS